jgi:tRNA isopentenyl-2-thiomethyl-A-37 hydroxylase MiaE
MIELIDKYCKAGNTKTIDEMRQEIREEVRHLRVREWANY